MLIKNYCGAVQELKLVASMVLCRFANGGVSIFYKLAIGNGMKIEILMAYQFIFATIFIVPLALFLERSRPKLTWTIAFQGFVCGLLGAALGISLYAESLVLTSATFASAMNNLTPPLTLILAVIFRLEKLDIKKSAGKTKLIGTVLGIGGAMVLTLYKGKNITLWSTNNIDLLAATQTNHQKPKLHKNLLLGSLYAVCSCLCFAVCLIVQRKMSKAYPSYSSTALICLSGAIMNGVYAICMEPHWQQWKLGWNLRLVASAYSGIIGSGMAIAMTSWISRVKGPIYISSFYPMSLIFVAIISSLFLDEKLHLGSMIGSVFIIVGLYLVLWGKSKEMKIAESNSKTTDDDNNFIR